MATEMKRVNSRFPEQLATELDDLVEQDRFESRSAAIRYAVRQMLQRQYNHD